MIEESQHDFTPPQTTRSGRRRIVSNHIQDNEEEKVGAVVAKHEDEPNHKSEQNGVETSKEVDAQQSSLVKIQVRPKVNVARVATSSSEQQPQRNTAQGVGRRRTRQAAGGAPPGEAEE
jgi:hypothetical protein